MAFECDLSHSSQGAFWINPGPLAFEGLLDQAERLSRPLPGNATRGYDAMVTWCLLFLHSQVSSHPQVAVQWACAHSSGTDSWLMAHHMLTHCITKKVSGTFNRKEALGERW